METETIRIPLLDNEYWWGGAAMAARCRLSAARRINAIVGGQEHVFIKGRLVLTAWIGMDICSCRADGPY
ncbi:hypothetical protein KNP414_04287 [Paenibacillus mucilaginosus KNP414]|uniref:Uncharacterized protein n=1 Tax=Paenibacillus mucilaginosus (strain KNP414) TaxID=1036673 RepID=F8FHW2_PAEMK|nr:hypothetical protein KNP414_04287 [Paenibacillus mucilaginosus KNP414]